MTNYEALNFLLNIAVKGETAYHAGYARTVQYAKDCKAYFGGVNVDEYMRPFTRRESEELFQQRKDITAQVQSSLGNTLDKPFAKIERSNWTKVVTLPSDQDGEAAKAFDRGPLAMFHKKGLFGYTFERLRYWNKYDPNAFIAVEFGQFDNRRETAKPYPFEVTAEMAVDFRYNQTDLEYLVARQVQEKKDGDVMVKVQRLTLYQPKQTVVLQQLTNAEVRALSAGSAPDTFQPTVSGDEVVKVNNKDYYQAIIPLPHGYDKTPAVRAGYIENPADDGRTVLSIFDAGMPFAKKLLKINSELDIVMALLAFPVSIRHEEQCDATGCDHGMLPDGTHCAACNGTGYKKRPTSAQEEILLPLPRSGEQMMDVDKILTYTYPPTDAIRLQVEVWEKWVDRAFKSVFSSEMYTKDQVAQTEIGRAHV